MKRNSRKPVLQADECAGSTLYLLSYRIAGNTDTCYTLIFSLRYCRIQLVVYALYNPLKKVSSIAVLVGACAGSIALLIGMLQVMMFECGDGLFALQFSGNFPISGHCVIAHKDMYRQDLNIAHLKKVKRNIRPTGNYYSL